MNAKGGILLIVAIALLVAGAVFGFRLFRDGSPTDRTESIFNELRTVNETLLAGSNQSARDLIEAREQLKRLRDELTKLKERLQGLKEESSQAQSILAKANEELKLASESYKKSASEAKQKIKSLEWQRNVLAVIAGFLAVRK